MFFISLKKCRTYQYFDNKDMGCVCVDGIVRGWLICMWYAAAAADSGDDAFDNCEWHGLVSWWWSWLMEYIECWMLMMTINVFVRVPMPPVKSWIFLLKFPGLEKSWKVSLVQEIPGIYLWFNLTNMPFQYRTPCVNKCMEYSCYVLPEQFLCNWWWTFCDGLHCHTVYRVTNCGLSLIQHCWATTESWKRFWGSCKRPGIFCKQESGNPGL